MKEKPEFKCTMTRLTVLEMAVAEVEANWSHVDQHGYFLELRDMAEEMRLVLMANLVGEEIQ